MATKRQTFRLYPNKEQERVLSVARRNHAYLYNACVAHCRYEWRANQKTVTYFEQQNCLPDFKKEWVDFAYLHSQAMQATVKLVDLAYGAFFQGLRSVKHGSVTFNDLGITLRMRGQAKQWGVPTTLTVVYKPSKNQWFASITVDLPTIESKFGSSSDLSYESIVAFDLGTETALTLYDGEVFTELENPRFTQKAEQRIKQKSKALRRKRAPNKSKKIKGSRRWKKARKQISQLLRWVLFCSTAR